MADPFSQVHDAIWSLLESSATVASNVKPGSRIKFTAQELPLKDVVSNADVPELRLMLTQTSFELEKTSSSSIITQQWEIQLATGSWNLKEKLLPLQWAIACAWIDWHTYIKTLTWEGRPYVHLARPLTNRSGVNFQDLNRGINGWASVFTIEIQMNFKTSSM